MAEMGTELESKIWRLTGFWSGLGVLVFRSGADSKSIFSASAHLWRGRKNISYTRVQCILATALRSRGQKQTIFR